MNRLTAALAGFLTLIFSFAARAQTASVKKSDDRSLLWRISGKDMKSPSYLFGTIHLICPDDYVWTPAMKQALASCHEVCFEMDMDDPSVMMEVASGMIDNSGKTLKEYFSEQDYKFIERFIKDSLGMNIFLFQQMKPAALQSLFATRSVNCASPVSYEANIQEEAKKLKMAVSGLEEPQEQLKLLNDIPQDSIIRELVDMAKDYSRERAEYQRMLAAYKQQDLPSLYAIIESSEVSGEDLGSFLDERNKKWIPRMEGHMEQGPVFFAVGAGHLAGANGLIELLRTNGYTVESVRISDRPQHHVK